MRAILYHRLIHPCLYPPRSVALLFILLSQSERSSAKYETFTILVTIIVALEDYKSIGKQFETLI